MLPLIELPIKKCFFSKTYHRYLKKTLVLQEIYLFEVKFYRSIGYSAALLKAEVLLDSAAD
jgi:hypothetical protein